MAKSYVVNRLGDRSFPFYIPSTASNASEFLNLLDGEWEIYEQVSTQGNETVSGEFKHVTVMVQDDNTKLKTYMRFYIPSTKDEDDIVAALSGKTFNNVKADAVYVLNVTWVGSTSGTSSGG